MTSQEQNKPQGFVVTKDEVNLIKHNVASIFSNSQNIFYEKGKEYPIRIISYLKKGSLTEDKCSDVIRGAASKLFDVACNSGSDILSSTDPFAKALEIFGRKVVANSLTKVLATHCSGVFGVFTSMMPTVSKRLPQIQS